ncbi:hypothetical protein KY363_02005 [Candidatus Woesearchaeota archaeon]|nr:hypothetical protein [Candidatus Woesearchaeota archaeon]
MTKQLTIKLNEEQFQPLIDELKRFTGEAMGETNSDFVAKTLFFAYMYLKKKQPGVNKTLYEVLDEQLNFDKSEIMLQFMNEYAEFKKVGLAVYDKKKD